jgi:hypothetical protein
LITQGAILFLLFAAMPTSLKAQTNLPAETNLNSAVATAGSPASDTNLPQKNQPVRIDPSGVHIGGPTGLGLGNTLVAIMPFFFPVAIIAVVFYFKHRRNQLAHETLRAMIEKSVPVTPELIASLNVRAKKHDEAGNPQTRYLLPGLILVGIGIGLMTLATKPGLIVLFIGAAFLIVWLVERKTKTTRNHPGHKPCPLPTLISLSESWRMKTKMPSVNWCGAINRPCAPSWRAWRAATRIWRTIWRRKPF